MRILHTVTIFLIIAGCNSTTGSMRTITSTPSGALVTIEGYGVCETPCTIKLDSTRNVTVAKAGFLAQRFLISPTGDPVEVILELAAPSGEVDAETLPDL